MPADGKSTLLCGAVGADESGEPRAGLVGECRIGEKLFCRLYRKCPHGEGNTCLHDELCNDTQQPFLWFGKQE